MSAQNFQGPEANKPEWFSIVESDTRIQKSPRDRGIRIMALAGPLLLVSAGLLFAQTNDVQGAAANESSSISSPVASGSTELASAPTGDVGVATDAVATQPSSPKVAVDNNVRVASHNSSNSSIATQSAAAPQSVHSPQSTPVTTNKVVAPTTNQGFVAPVPSVTQSSSSSDDDDDDAFESDEHDGHDSDGDHDDERSDHEDSDEGDDD